jgi:hypothetical protein
MSVSCDKCEKYEKKDYEICPKCRRELKINVDNLDERCELIKKLSDKNFCSYHLQTKNYLKMNIDLFKNYSKTSENEGLKLYIQLLKISKCPLYIFNDKSYSEYELKKYIPLFKHTNLENLFKKAEKEENVIYHENEEVYKYIGPEIIVEFHKLNKLFPSLEWNEILMLLCNKDI